jgi:hypothetical protein
MHFSKAHQKRIKNVFKLHQKCIKSASKVHQKHLYNNFVWEVIIFGSKLKKSMQSVPSKVHWMHLR